MKKEIVTKQHLSLLETGFLKLVAEQSFKNKLSVYQDGRTNITGWGYTCIYTEAVGKINGRLGKDKITGNRYAMIWLDAEINPNGITGKDDIGITYTIHYELKANVRLYRHKYFNEATVLKFYGYGRTPEEILTGFRQFLTEDYYSFMTDPKLNRVLNKEYNDG